MASVRTRTLSITKDNTSRVHPSSGDYRQGSGGDHHWLAGRVFDTGPDRTYEYWTTAQIGLDWSDMGRILSAELVVRATSSTGNPHVEIGNSGRLTLYAISPGVDSWSEGNRGEDSFGSDEYEKPKVTGATSPRVTSEQIPSGIETAIDIMPLMQFWAPESMTLRIGGRDVQGAGHTNRGFRAYETTDKTANAMCFHSRHATNSSYRPRVEITFEPDSTKPSAAKVQPTGDVNDAPLFLVNMQDEDPDQKLSAYQIQVRRVSNGDTTWNTEKVTASILEGDARQASIRAPASKWGVGIPQEWRAKVWDSEKPTVESDWTSWGNSFTVTGGVPTLGTPQPIGSVSSMAGKYFAVSWSHPQGKAIASLRIQARASTPPGDPSWDGADNVWDTGDVIPTAGEKGTTPPGIYRTYGGDSLYAGNYSWRAMVTDVLGAKSAWVYGTWTLTASYDDKSPDEDNVGFGRRVLGTRIILRAMGTKRGPGALRAIIEDAENIGASAYASAPGELYFTLPATHPQVGECEPYKTHYALETYRNGSWQEMFAGIITDFDATGDDAVINGMDYLGLLSLDVERRSWITGTSKKDPKYHDKTISYIIADQLDAAIATSNSPVGFIERPDSGPVFNPMGTKIHIDGSYRQRLEFIRGLIDSFRAGTGLRSRLFVRRKPGSTADETHGYSYQFSLLTDSGRPRPAMRMEYGGLIQGFRIQAFGDFTVKVLAIGRETGELKPHYKEATAPGLSAATWGNLARVAVWQDIEDENDLARRAAQLAAESGRIGKRMALGLRVHGVGPFDGWEMTDSIPIDIVRGVIDTGHFAPDSDGLSWWTIWGTEWRISPDGHDELTLVVRPREDALPPDPDLIIGKPFVPTPEWKLGAGVPSTATMAAPFSMFYLDTETNDVYELTEDPVTGDVEYVLEAEGGGGGTTPPPPAVTPSVPSGLTTTPGFQLMGLSWLRESEADLETYQVRYARDDGTGTGPGLEPSWTIFDTKSTSVVISGLDAGYTDPDPAPPDNSRPAVQYWFAVRAIDTDGMTKTSAIDATLAPASADLGWSDMEDGTPSLVGVGDMAVNSLVANFINTGTISADQITSGTIDIGKPGTGAVLEMYDSGGNLVGRWDEDGLLILRHGYPNEALWITSAGLYVSDAYTGDVTTTAWSTSITATGINATAIAYGSSPGGHNALPNAGFELTPFSSPTTKTWTATADWATGTSQVNVTTSGADLTLTTATY